jgi:uncharacterized membrane protein YebE (DUF533 family)
MRHPAALLAAALLAASTALCAQAPQGGDAAKQERREKMKAAHQKARSACESKQGDAHRDCMRKEMCAQAKDPGRCEAEAKERAARREQIRQACKGKEGEAFKACVREQRGNK